MEPIVALLLGLAVVVSITIATGYFVAQEFAYMAVDRSRLTARAASGDKAAQRALDVTRRTSFMLSGAQLGITVTGLLVGYVAEPLIGQSLGDLLGGIGVPVAVSVGIGALVALVVSTVVQMIFGELFPKNLAIARAETVALRLAATTTAYLTAMGWLITFFDKASNMLLGALKIEPVHDVEHAASARDLEHIVAESRETGDLPEELSVMIDRILDFPTRDVEHAMIPRAHVDVVHGGDTIADLRVRMAHGHSRYPVLAADTDEVLGVVHLPDLLATDEPGKAAVTSIVRPALVVAALMPLMRAADRLISTGNQMACVVDEFGGFAGVLTLEDLAEELVGEITDEHDSAAPTPTPLPDDGVWFMAGDVHIDEVERALGLDLPRGDYETIAGLLIAQFEGLPEAGTVVDVLLPLDPGLLARDEEPERVTLHAEVVEVVHYVPGQVRLTLSSGPAPDPDDQVDDHE